MSSHHNTEREVEQTFTIADLRAQLAGERIARVTIIDALVDKIVDNVALTHQVAELSARVAELADENQLLRDDAEQAPVPFSIVTPVQVLGTSRHLAAVVPDQRNGAGS